ncbi:MAG: PLP-dependent aspartate aminotransferase family protein, partial [Euryarchaeota archaeon]|nr:PLP-dependent aspartate aminotransferase family protein [Euryarchaeota archaeon]
LGADAVLHSATKYIGGHSDVVGGALVVSDEALGEKLHWLQNAIGGVMDPWSAYLAHRGLKTLHVRMDRQAENARYIAEHLETHGKIEAVWYPGLTSNDQYPLAKRQMRTPGAMVSFEVRGGLKAGLRFMKSVRLWTLAESLGAVESLVDHPASMTHGGIPKAEREASGLTDGLIRLSVGLESIDDLVEDLEQALGKT